MNIGYVNAIESGDYSIFPSEGFAKAYFIKYQNFLSLECEFPPIYNDKNRQEEIINKSIAKINPSIYPIIRVTGIFIIVVAIIFFININFLLKVITHMMKVVTVLGCWYSNLSYCTFLKFALNHPKVLPDENPYHWKQSLP